MYHATVVTLFPQMFPGILGASIPKRALDLGLWSLDTVNIRDFAFDKHGSVDDSPYGGGQGMIMKPDVVDAALQHAFNLGDAHRPIIYLTPLGSPLTHTLLKDHHRTYTKGAIFLCGRYEGIDHRVIEEWSSKRTVVEVSLGDFILSGGEVAAQAYLDAYVRLIPGAVSNQESVIDESFSLDLLEYFQYTRPYEWNGRRVPDILLSGDHQKIRAWRMNQSKEITQQKRPDMWAKYDNKW